MATKVGFLHFAGYAPKLGTGN